MTLKLMTDLDLTDRRVLIRQDLNVPIKDGQVTSAARIKASLPTIRLALQAGAKVIVMSHLGRPSEGSVTSEHSLEPVAQFMSEQLGKPVNLVEHWREGLRRAMRHFRHGRLWYSAPGTGINSWCC
jgi:phosphoglycerate kinase